MINTLSSIKISLIRDDELKPPRPKIMPNNKITGPFRRMNLKNVVIEFQLSKTDF